MTFRVLKFEPHEQPQAAPSQEEGAPSKPTRMKAPRGHDNAWWWEGIDRDEILIQKCNGCGTLHHPPRPMCNQCRSTDLGSVVASGKGEIYTYTVLHHPQLPGYEYPLISALIALEEGTRLVANVVGCKPEEVHIGMAVQGAVEQVDEVNKLPVFRPVS
jgi:uncharacterized OB-fold protein